jgi:hypothetical protein
MRSPCCLYMSHIVATQRLVKHVAAATNTHETIELLHASFSMRSVSYQRKLDQSNCAAEDQQQFSSQVVITRAYF